MSTHLPLFDKVFAGEPQPVGRLTGRDLADLGIQDAFERAKKVTG